jgi:hypothetical protein
VANGGRLRYEKILHCLGHRILGIGEGKPHAGIRFNIGCLRDRNCDFALQLPFSDQVSEDNVLVQLGKQLRTDQDASLTANACWRNWAFLALVFSSCGLTRLVCRMPNATAYVYPVPVGV